MSVDRDRIFLLASVNDIEAITDFVTHEYRILHDSMPSPKQDFRIVEVPESKTLKVCWEDGRSLDLKDFLPKGYTFRAGQGYANDWLHSEIIYDPQKLDRRSAIISLFHEIGHSYVKDRSKLPIWFQELCLYPSVLFSMFKTIRKISKSRFVDLNFVRELLKSNPIDSFISLDTIERDCIAQSKIERGCWAYGLSMMRGLKRKGYDLFTGYNTVHEIKLEVSACLATYDMSTLSEFSNNLNFILGQEQSEYMGKRIFEPRNEFLDSIQHKLRKKIMQRFL